MRKLPYHLLALIVVICWGLSMVSTKVLIEHGMKPWAIVELRSLLAYGVLILLAPSRLYAGSARNEILVAVLGLASVPLSFGLQNLALASGSVATTSVLVASGPLIAAVLALFPFNNARMNWMTFLGICSAATGVFLLYFDAVVMSELPADGFWLGVGAAAAYAFYAVLRRMLADLPPLVVLRKTMGYGAFFALPFFLAEPETPVIQLTRPIVYLNFIFLSLVTTAVGGTLWQMAERRVGAMASRLYHFLWPLIAIAGGMWFLGEKAMSYIGFMGAGMILCGVVCAQTGAYRVAQEVAKRW